MSLLGIRFPNDRERLRRLIEADGEKSFLERIHAVDGLLSTVARFKTSGERSRPSLRDQREAEFRACWHELAQRTRSGR